MKKIEIEIPEGKRAEWINGVLTLVDEPEVDNRAGMTDILNELASRIESAEIVNVRQVLEWIEEQTKE